MFQIQKKCCVFLLFLSLLELTRSDGKDFTVEVAGGQRECFFETLKKTKGEDDQVTVEYQVLDGGDLLVDASLHTPTGTLVFADFRKTENSHRFAVMEDGEYQLCFDNGVSAYYERIVFFSFNGDGMDDDDFEDDDEDENYFKKVVNKDLKDVMEYDGKVNDFKYRFERIHKRIETIGHLQTTIRSVESRDRHIAERNYEKVNFWSMINLAVMVLVLVLQVFLIRSLFDDKSLLNRQLNKLSAFSAD